MTIRRAVEKDMDRILALLTQVLEIHADARPDIFIHGTTKYTREELGQVLRDENSPVYVAVDGDDTVMGYVFCVFKEQPLSSNMVPFQSVYIDDLCVDEKYRGQQIATQLFAYVRELARSRVCYEVTLNVWRGNDGARAFYEKMGMQELKTMMEYIL